MVIFAQALSIKGMNPDLLSNRSVGTEFRLGGEINMWCRMKLRRIELFTSSLSFETLLLSKKSAGIKPKGGWILWDKIK